MAPATVLDQAESDCRRPFHIRREPREWLAPVDSTPQNNSWSGHKLSDTPERQGQSRWRSRATDCRSWATRPCRVFRPVRVSIRNSAANSLNPSTPSNSRNASNPPSLVTWAPRNFIFTERSKPTRNASLRLSPIGFSPSPSDFSLNLLLLYELWIRRTRGFVIHLGYVV